MKVKARRSSGDMPITNPGSATSTASKILADAASECLADGDALSFGPCHKTGH
jgi:hypothetical protein